MSLPFYGDAPVYLAGGRAIVNGLIPYRDFLEVKPPGIFFLSALSFLFTGSIGLAFALRILTLVGLPILLVTATILSSQKTSPFQRLLAILLAGILGTQMMLHVMIKAGGFQTEAFGLFFATAYLLVLVSPYPKKRWRTALLALFMGATIGLKEPFLLSITATAIFLSHTRREFWKNFLLPFLIAGMGGILLLLILGILGPYVDTYLPAIFGDRLLEGGPLLFRGLYTLQLFDDILRFNSMIPIAGSAILFLLLSSPILHHPQQLSWTILLTLFALLGILICMESVFEFLTAAQLLPLHVLLAGENGHGVFRRMGLPLIITMGLLFFLNHFNKESFLRLITTAISVYLVTLGAGAGNFLSQHLLFALPLYMAAFLLLVRATQNSWNAPSTRLIAGGTSLLLFLTLFGHPNRNLQETAQKFAKNGQEIELSRTQASRTDSILDQCGFQRYLPIGGWELTAFTHHSPLDLAWTELRAFGSPPNQSMRERFFENLDRAQLVLYNQQKLPNDSDFASVLRNQFTPTPPPCAEKLPAPENFVMLFRSNIAPKLPTK